MATHFQNPLHVKIEHRLQQCICLGLLTPNEARKVVDRGPLAHGDELMAVLLQDDSKPAESYMTGLPGMASYWPASTMADVTGEPRVGTIDCGTVSYGDNTRAEGLQPAPTSANLTADQVKTWIAAAAHRALATAQRNKLL